MTAVPGGASRDRWELGGYRAAVDERLAAWSRERAVERLWRTDPSLWPAAPAAEPADRLGWLSAPEVGTARADELRAFAEGVRADGVEHVVLLGMGGSSLASEVIARTLPRGRGAPALRVLDSTHPAAVRACQDACPPGRTLYVVSSKSGTTLEPNAFLRYFWAAAGGAAASRRFVAITDPGTPLEKLAKERGFRACFGGPPDVGGRYSALTVFGLVPAVLLGVDLDGLLADARAMAVRCREPQPGANPGLALGAALGELARAGRDKLVLLTSPGLRAFPAWTEQLVAESLGKIGKGIVPVAACRTPEQVPPSPDVTIAYLARDGETTPAVDRDLAARASVGTPVLRFDVGSPVGLGAEFFRWEVAIAACGAVIGVDPFDQPDVEFAKELARTAMADAAAGARSLEAYGEPVPASGPAGDTLRRWLASVQPRDYVAVQAFLAPTDATGSALGRLVDALRRRLGVVVTVGYGPRFLHSTGQLHKGGPPTGVFLQIVDEPATDLPVPEMALSFARILRAQARGDRTALESRQRRVYVANVAGAPEGGVARLAELVAG